MTYPYKVPLPNLASDELLATGNTMALLTYDPAMFDDMVLPDGVSRDSVVNCILEMHGHATLFHPDPLYMRRAIKAWSERRCQIWIKLLATTMVEYNPIHNYDRTEIITDTTKEVQDGTIESETSGTTTNTADNTNTTEYKVSAENSNDYQPDSTDAVTGHTGVSGTNTANSNTSTSNTRTTEYSHQNRTSGNIGVTTTQQMLQSEREVVRYSVIEEIAADYHTTFCLDIY